MTRVSSGEVEQVLLESRDMDVLPTHKNSTFFKKIKSSAHQALAWGLVWKDPKGFMILIKFSLGVSLKGSERIFDFDKV